MTLQIHPAFSGENNVPLVFSANKEFVLGTSAMIRSIIAHASDRYTYDIVILTRDIDADYEKRLQSMAIGYGNISIRVVNVSVCFDGYALYTENRDTITVEAYFRLVIPYIMEGYAKAIYLDGDMIANVDVAELFETELSGYALAAVVDVNNIGNCRHRGQNRKRYQEEVLKLKYPERYFNSGLLVMDLNWFREKMTCEELLALAASSDWEYHDQDVLNKLCNEEVKLLPIAWNAMPDMGNNQYAPEAMYQEALTAEESPKIIHLAGWEKPWLFLTLDVKRSRYFWKYAGDSPFLEEIMLALRRTQRNYFYQTAKENTLEQFAQGEIGLQYIAQFFFAWLKYKLKPGKRS